MEKRLGGRRWESPLSREGERKEHFIAAVGPLELARPRRIRSEIKPNGAATVAFTEMVNSINCSKQSRIWLRQTTASEERRLCSRWARRARTSVAARDLLIVFGHRTSSNVSHATVDTFIVFE